MREPLTGTMIPVSLRADAKRNYEAVLAAARRVLGERGTAAGMAEIAREAGVGVGTLYRRFPTKEALVQALLLDRLEHDAELLRSAAALEGGAWAGFERALRFVAHAQLEDRALKQLVGGTVPETGELTAARRELFTLAAELAARAQEEGSLRPDLERGDLPLLFGGVAQAEWLTGERAVEVIDRYVTIVLDGLRAPGQTPLAGEALEPDEVEAMFRAG
jgi:AcrR family transcriptional regulator